MSDFRNARNWPAHAGEMAAWIRSHDWAKTAIGPIETWPDALRTVIDLALDCPTAIIVGWGPDLIQIYNDSCRALLHARHPAAFAAPARQIWSDIWPFDGKIIQTVLAGSAQRVSEFHQQFEHDGKTYDGYFDLGFCPLRGNHHEVCGILLTITDNTEQVERNRFQKFRIDLEQRLRPLREPQAIMRAAAEMLCRALHADEVMYADVEPSGRVARVEECWSRHGYPPSDIPVVLDDFNEAYALRIRAGEVVVVNDVKSDALQFDAVALAFLAHRHVGAYIKIPLMKDSMLLAGLGVHSEQPRVWRAADIALAQQAAEATWAAVERARAEAESRDSAERLRLALDVAHLGGWDWNIQTGEASWSIEHYHIMGYEVGEITPGYDAWISRVHPQDRSAAEAAIDEALQNRCEFSFVHRLIFPDGSIHSVAPRGRFFYDAEGKPIRMLGVVRDITEERRNADTQALLIGELQHRTRNLLAVVQSLATQIAASSADLDEFRPRFTDRLAALSRVQGLLSRSDRNRVTMGELVRSELDALGVHDGRIQISGPDISLRRSAVQTLALALHELATNARKYGALNEAGGTLDIHWHVEAGSVGAVTLELSWIEKIPRHAAMPPAKGGGYGRRLIEQALPYSLNAQTNYQLHEFGLDCSIHVPLDELTSPEGAP